MEKAVVATPLTELRRESEFESERLSQVLFNEELTVPNLEKRYVQVEHTQVKTEEAWVYARHLESISCERETNRPKVSVTLASVYSEDGIHMMFLPFSAGVTVWENGAERVKIGTSERSYGWVSTGQLIEPEQIEYSPEEFVEYGTQFLGVPYLWGGTTPFGFDCSGLILRLFEYYGLVMPNSTDLQQECGEGVTWGDMQPGDILFFEGHAGIYAGNNHMLHANLLRGGVSLDSLDPQAATYHPIVESLEVIKRIIP